MSDEFIIFIIINQHYTFYKKESGISEKEVPLFFSTDESVVGGTIAPQYAIAFLPQMNL
jgi:hypothetical protein